MDTEAAITFLVEYRSTLFQVQRRPTTLTVDRMYSDRSTAYEVVERAMPGQGRRIVVPETEGLYFAQAAIDALTTVIGHLRNQDRRKSILATPAPHLAADELHPWVWEAARRLWETGNYREAVQAAATLVSAETQRRVARRDVSDATLMRSVFGDGAPKPGQPRLRWPGDGSDQTVRSMNEGIRGVAQGLFAAVRNPSTHDLQDVPVQQALEQLAAFSLLARWIEQCDVVTDS